MHSALDQLVANKGQMQLGTERMRATVWAREQIKTMT